MSENFKNISLGFSEIAERIYLFFNSKNKKYKKDITEDFFDIVLKFFSNSKIIKNKNTGDEFLVLLRKIDKEPNKNG